MEGQAARRKPLSRLAILGGAVDAGQGSGRAASSAQASSRSAPSGPSSARSHGAIDMLERDVAGIDATIPVAYHVVKKFAAVPPQYARGHRIRKEGGMWHVTLFPAAVATSEELVFLQQAVNRMLVDAGDDEDLEIGCYVAGLREIAREIQRDDPPMARVTADLLEALGAKAFDLYSRLKVKDAELQQRQAELAERQAALQGAEARRARAEESAAANASRASAAEAAAAVAAQEAAAAAAGRSSPRSAAPGAARGLLGGPTRVRINKPKLRFQDRQVEGHGASPVLLPLPVFVQQRHCGVLDEQAVPPPLRPGLKDSAAPFKFA